MGQRLIISEQEKRNIQEMYGLITESPVAFLVNAAKGKIMNELNKLLYIHAIPALITEFNKNVEFSDSAGNFEYGISSKITKGDVVITDMEARDEDGEKSVILVDIVADLNLKGVVNGYVKDVVDLKEAQINFTDTKLMATVRIDYKGALFQCGKGEDDRNISLVSFEVIINSSPTTLYFEGLEDPDPVGTVQVNNNVLSAKVDDLGLSIEERIPVNTFMSSFIEENKEKLFTYKFKDYPQILIEIPLIKAEC